MLCESILDMANRRCACGRCDHVGNGRRRRVCVQCLPLFPLLLLFWYLQRFSAKDVGFVWGKSHALRCYGFAILYPIVVMGSITAIAALMGALNIVAVGLRSWCVRQDAFAPREPSTLQ